MEARSHSAATLRLRNALPPRSCDDDDDYRHDICALYHHHAHNDQCFCYRPCHASRSAQMSSGAKCAINRLDLEYETIDSQLRDLTDVIADMSC